MKKPCTKSFGFSVLNLDKSLHYSTFVVLSQTLVLGSKMESTKDVTSKVRRGRCKVGFDPLLEYVLL